MTDDEEMTDAEAEELFGQTQPIGHAIYALAAAELTVAAVDDLPPEVSVRLEQIRRIVLGNVTD
ncbi:hypothetical protein [Gordonia iterans]